MKTRIKTSGIVLLLILFSLIHAEAQTRAGLFLAYGDHQEGLGIGAIGEFFVTDAISISPNVIYFFDVEDNEFMSTDSWFDLNLNGNYHFSTSGVVMPYVLAGLNYSMRKFDYDGGFSEDDNNIGFNIGAGSDFDFGSSIIPFAQVRYAFSDSGQLVIAAGIKIGFGE